MQSTNIYFTGDKQTEVRVEDQRPPGPGEVLVRASRSLISTGTELNCYARNWAPGTYFEDWVRYPFAPGYSSVGTVIEVGAGVENLKPGMRVATGTPHREYVVCAASQALPTPDSISDDEAAFFSLASIVQNGVRRAEPVLGETVVIMGLGLLGQLAVQYVRLTGALEVIAIDLSAARLEIARAHGATHTLCMPFQEAKAEVARLTGGRLADCVYDVSGFAPAFPHALTLARTLGKVLLLGSTGFPDQQHLSSDLIRRGITVRGAHGNTAPTNDSAHTPWTHPNMQKLFFTYLERGQMRVADLVSRRCAPQEAQAVYESLLQDRSSVMGVLFDWSGPDSAAGTAASPASS